VIKNFLNDDNVIKHMTTYTSKNNHKCNIMW
jgi:hypothetical protein